MTPFSQALAVDYTLLAPLLVVLGAACVSVLVEAVAPMRVRRTLQPALAVAAVAVALVVVVLLALGPVRSPVVLAGALSVDPAALFLWGTLLALAVPSLLLLAEHAIEPGGVFVADPEALATATATPAAPRGAGAGGGGSSPVGSTAGSTSLATTGAADPARPGVTDARTGGPAGGRDRRGPGASAEMHTEVYAFALFALGGMLAFSAANDLLTMFVALEVLSLPLYLLCGLARRRRMLSQESAVKYFLLGAFTSAFFLYGVALIYGYADSVRLSDVAAAAAGSLRPDSLLYAGLALLTVGLLFKASVGPFHTWTPDVYQGAPTAVTAFMAACTKVAAFGALLRVLSVGFSTTVGEWRGVMWAVAIISMVVGVILGITQTDVKRMIAYSSVAHAGFLMLGTIALTPAGRSGTLFYLLAYGFTTIALFGLVSLVRGPDGEAGHLSAWAGMGRRSPVLAASMSFLLLALAGVPLTSGFTAKFAVFSAALADGMVPLVLVALACSAIAAFFYLRMIVLMYFSEPAADGPTVSVPGPFTTVAVTLGVVVTLLLGVAPTAALQWAGAGVFLG